MADVFCVVNRSAKLTERTKKIVLSEPLAYDNSYAHSMRATLFNDDETPADLTGVSSVASMYRSDGRTVSPINGTVSGNVAEVILPPSCYVSPGLFKFTMNLFKATEVTEETDEFSSLEDYVVGDVVVYDGVVFRFKEPHSAGEWTGDDVLPDGAYRTILWVEGYVERNISDELVDPGHPVGNIANAIASAQNAAQEAYLAAADARSAASHSVIYDNTQSLTASQKAVARSNIGLTYTDDGEGNITVQ